MLRFTLSLAVVSSLSCMVTCAPSADYSPTIFERSALLAGRQAPTCTAPEKLYYSNGSGYVCIQRPDDCTQNYTVQPDDTCLIVATLYNTSVTATELFHGNPEIGRSCEGIRAYVPVCVASASYNFTGPQVKGDFLSAAAQPVPLQPGIVSNCTTFEYLGANTNTTTAYTVSDVLRTANITLDQFIAYNGQTKDNPFVYGGGYWVCVKA